MTIAPADELLAAEVAHERLQPARAMVRSLEELAGPTLGVVTLPLRID